MDQRILDVLELASKASFQIEVKDGKFTVMVTPRDIFSFNPNDEITSNSVLWDIEYEADSVLKSRREWALREERRNSALSKLTPEEREALDLKD